ncbi:MAG: glycosyltransferase [Oscillatoria sp. SIO1A7]|nr:glycosyltransferase [Oscillatoria sp. SIO1A7]
MPLISVIIPVYNGEKTINETIQSVLKQTLSDLEIIVIDDGSQDGTLEIVKGIQDERIKVFSYPNAGLSSSRNRGFSHAVGEFISFLDADDLWLPDKLESQFRALQENPQAALAYSWTDYIDESGQWLHPGDRITVKGEAYELILLGNFLESGSNALLRREAFTKAGVFDESLVAGEDWDLFIRIAAVGYKFVATEKAQIWYRMTDTSMSSNFSRQEAECLKVINQAFSLAPESLLYLKSRSIANLYQYLMFRTLKGSLSREKNLLAARYFWQAVRNDPALLRRRSRLMAIVFLKIAAGIIFPPAQARILLERIKKIFA